MNYLSVENISKSYGERILFQELFFGLSKGDKMALIANNGTGKSSMLKIIAGKDVSESGKITLRNGIRIGYLEQDPIFNEAFTIKEFLENSNSEIMQIIKGYDKALELQTNDFNDATSQRFQEASLLMDKANAWNFNNELNQILSRFKIDDLNQNLKDLSGGQRKRLSLATLIMDAPELLLLDEPTNHLDIESIQWLEQYLKNYPGIILLISHDKKFLDNITNRTIELANAKLYDYKCNYSKYLTLREEEILTQIAAKKNQDKMVKHTQELINKFRAKKNKAAFAQSLIKKLDKLEDIEIAQLEKDRIQFQFPEPSHSGKETLKISNLEKSYGDKQIFRKVDLSVARGEKIALIGKNGMGKSTFIKSIVKDIEFSGNIDWGHQVMMGYFAQDEAHKLDPKKTVFETIDDVAVGEVRKQIRPILGSFLFSGEDIDKKVQVLSGGEKTRLSLCKLLLQPNNFLILDEPTNHLDITSKELLKKALNNYDGSLIIVSHDREFLQGLTKKVYEFKNQNIKEYIGDIDTFLSEKDLENFKQLESSQKDQKNTKQDKSDERSSFKENKNQKKQVKQLQNKISKLEKKIEELDKAQKEVDMQLSDPEKFKELSSNKDFFDQYDINLKEKQKLELEWEKSIDKLENIS